MTWRWIPPVWSPVSPGALIAGAAAAAGVGSARRDAVRASVIDTFGARDCVLTDSGTSALVCALRALVPRDGFVALPAYVCIDVIAAARRAGVRVRLYDVDPATLSPDIDSVRRALARGVNAIVIAPLYGYPADVPGVTAAAAERGVAVIEDAAQGAGAEIGGRRHGTFGDFAILSFGRGKGTTGGSGGALLVHTPRAAEAMQRAPQQLHAGRGARDVVALAAQWLLARPALYRLPASIPSLHLGEMVYHDAQEPRGISAAASRIVSAALRADPAEVHHRRARAAALTAATARARRFTPMRAVAGGTPGFLRLAVLDASGDAAPGPNVGALRGYPVTLDEHPKTRDVLADGENAGLGARTLRDRLFTVPTHSRCSASDAQRVMAWLAPGAQGSAVHLGTRGAT